MIRFRQISLKAALVLLLISGVSCERFLNPEQELDITQERLYDDWYEYRSIEMGLYGLQQQMVEQLMILGELRGDLLTITDNADADLVEIYNFNISRDNKYASPTNFFKLITACNSFIRVLKTEKPDVLDPEEPVDNYDRLYGEALCMRAWAYFNAVRIYGKVPYIPESLTTMEEVDAFLNSGGTYIDSVHVVFGKDGYQNDTSYNAPVELEKQYYDLDLVLDHFIDELENDIKAVGVNHYIENNDETWEVSVWGTFSRHALLGHMYLTQGDYTRASDHFFSIIYNASETFRYRMDDAFAFGDWINIFKNIDLREHIYTIWFNKANFQQNKFQTFFEPFGPHEYMLKPSYPAIKKWESVWRYARINKNNERPELSKMAFPGIPSDFYRGFGFSYGYVKNGQFMSEDDYLNMIFLRADGDDRNSQLIMEGVDTIVYKYSIDKGIYDQDANYMIYRAAGIHLYLAELFAYWSADHLGSGIISPKPGFAANIMNDGSYFDVSEDREEMGIKGRVGLDPFEITNDFFTHDPYTNKIIGYTNLTGQLLKKQELLEDEILEERARELAFEGERFYDLMRIAKRRQDPSYLAKRVASKFPPGQREQIEALLMVEENWYIPYFE